MKPLHYPLFVGTVLLMGSCSKDAEEPFKPSLPEPSDPDRIEISIDPTISESRATDYGFETGDCIGLYVVNYTDGKPGVLADKGNHVDNMRFKYSGGWVPDTPIYWLDKETHADFYLYYPYTTITSVTAHPFSVSSNQSSETAYKAADFMVGKATNVAPSSGSTIIPVNHIMSRAIIELQPGNGFTAESLAAAKVDVKINGVKCSSTINLATGEVTPTGTATSVTPLLDGTYRAIIIPQTVAVGNLITVTVDGREYNLNKDFTFERGKSHQFTVTLTKTSNGVNVDINPWGDDGTDNGGTAE